MNAKRAKALRRQVYGEMSLRAKRRYLQLAPKDYGKTEKERAPWGTIVNDPASLRAQYQWAKKGRG